MAACRCILSGGLAIILLVIGLADTAQSQRSHNVTIYVPPMVHSLVTPSVLQMTIDGSGTTAGGSSFQVINLDTKFYWATNYLVSKVTVQAAYTTAPYYSLYIQAPSTVPGTELLVTTDAKEFITGLGRSMGSCTIQYRGVALATTEGGHSDTYTITYTLTIN